MQYIIKTKKALEANFFKEETTMNDNTNNNIVENPEPDWSLMMFWEDITAIIQKIAELIASLFGSL